MRAEALRLAGFLGAGAALSAMAWLHVGSLALLVLFPLGIAQARRRREAFAFAMGYFGLNSAELPSILLRFFEGDGLLLAAAAPAALALILAAPFVLAVQSTPARRAAGFLGALAIITLPPVGFIGWLNPLFAAAALFPGMAVAGVAATALLFAGLSAWVPAIRTGKGAAVVLIAIVLPATGANAGALLWPRPAVLGVYALNTDFGKPAETPAYRAAVIGEVARRVEFHSGPGFRLVVFPESILHDFGDTDRVMLMPSTNLPDRPPVWFGATIRRDDGRGENAVLALGRDYPVVTTSRLPVPIGNWRPFIAGGVVARPFASDMVDLGDLRVAVSVCYEDAVLWGHPGLMTGQADVLVSVANLWALGGTRTAYVQGVGAQALARMAGVPLRRAVNT